MMRKWAILAGMAAFSACTHPPVEETQLEPLPSLTLQQQSPQLALVEHVLAGHFAAHDVPPTICMALHDGRSDEAFSREDEVALMERFARLAPLSRCSQQGGQWIDHDNGSAATLMSLHSFTCASQGACTGWISTQLGDTADPSLRYSMEWDGGQWAFEADPRLILEQ